jgi:CheY-like chemotaxis protein
MAKMLTDLMGGADGGKPGRRRGMLPGELFLPSVDDMAAVAGAVAGSGGLCRGTPARAGGGQRRGRPGLLLQLLAPLGLDVQLAASGHAALALVAEGWVPHAVFMDLAMPGIDGWETLRRLRAMHGSAMACAVVSANAFDRELPNDVGITPQDFHKPVRHSELLLWLGRRLQLSWQYADEAPLAQTAPVAAPETVRTDGAPAAMPRPAAELGMDGNRHAWTCPRCARPWN